MVKPLTEAQARILAEVREAGEKIYNGRARRPIEALERDRISIYRATLERYPGGQYMLRPGSGMVLSICDSDGNRTLAALTSAEAKMLAVGLVSR